jgi:hypothetical protein
LIVPSCELDTISEKSSDAESLKNENKRGCMINSAAELFITSRCIHQQLVEATGAAGAYGETINPGRVSTYIRIAAKAYPYMQSTCPSSRRLSVCVSIDQIRISASAPADTRNCSVEE